MNFWKKAGVEIVCVGLIMILFLPLCGFLFRCGCQALWSTALSHCNIQEPGPPDCPWCTGSLLRQMVPFLLVCLNGVGGIHLIRRITGSRNFFTNLAAGLLAAFVTAVLTAWIYAQWQNYPAFRWF